MDIFLNYDHMTNQNDSKTAKNPTPFLSTLLNPFALVMQKTELIKNISQALPSNSEILFLIKKIFDLFLSLNIDLFVYLNTNKS